MRIIIVIISLVIVVNEDIIISSEEEDIFISHLAENKNSNIDEIILYDDEENYYKLFLLKNEKHLNLTNLRILENSIYSYDDKFLSKNIYNYTYHNDIYSKFISTKYLFWDSFFTGNNTKIGIFDSGINNHHLNCNIIENINYTDEIDEDLEGHGTFIASLICDRKIGIAPDSLIYSYKVFNKRRITYTSWLIKAIDHSIKNKLNILNFSFGGINLNDNILRHKIKEAINNNIIIIASAGNDGPSYATINFPGNLPEVLTVGACSKEIFNIFQYSSRGPAIYKKDLFISKPNTWAPGEDIPGFNNMGELILKSGSSVSTAIVSGFVSLLNQIDNELNNSKLAIMINQSNLPLPSINFGEIIGGVINPEGLMKMVQFYKDSNLGINILNNLIDFSMDSYDNYTLTEKDQNRINLYSSMQPLEFNILIVNAENNYNLLKMELDLDNYRYNTIFKCIKLDIIYSNNILIIKNFALIIFRLYIENNIICRMYNEKINWNIKFKESNLNFDLIFNIIPTPFKYERILVDRFHNLYYPFDGFIPRDDLFDKRYNYDWNNESIYGNYFNLFNYIKSNHYYIEELNESLECIDLSLYSVVIFIDSEKEFKVSELELLRYFHEEMYLSIFFITEWNNQLIKNSIKYNDIDTRSFNYPYVSGSEFNNLNDFLKFYGIKIGQDSLSNYFKVNKQGLKIKSASSITKFPSNSVIFGNYLSNDEYFISDQQPKRLYKAILGFRDQLYNKINSGRIAVFTDSYCLDDYQLKSIEENCFWMMKSIINSLVHGENIYNDLQISSRERLIVDYDDGNKMNYINKTDYLDNDIDNCIFHNFTTILKNSKYSDYIHIKTKTITSVIPNIIDKSLEGDDKKDENILLEYIENVLYALVPILVFLFSIFLIIKCKYIRMKRVKPIVSIAQFRDKAQASSYSKLDTSFESSSIIV